MLRLPRNAPTPMAGLALGIASLGLCWDTTFGYGGYVQCLAAGIAGVPLALLLIKFIDQPRMLWAELGHPVIGSVVPTFAMALMIISMAVGHASTTLEITLWLIAIVLHLLFMATFTVQRCRQWALSHVVPSWFVPPVGIIVADVTFPGALYLHELAVGLLYFGMGLYAVLLPLMLYRFMFSTPVPDAAKPTVAIMAAPASLSLAGYLTVVPMPSLLLVALLASIALLMTTVTYLALLHLLRLPFSPGYAAFTFPLVISATAMFKLAHWLTVQPLLNQHVEAIYRLAEVELAMATVVVVYVTGRYLHYYVQAAWRASTAAT